MKGPHLRETDEDKSRLGVSWVELQSFRNYAHVHVELDSGFNILAGPNAQGKTNFLESLYLLATTRLLRGQRDAEAIQEGSQRAVSSAQTRFGETKLSIVLERGLRKRAFLNDLASPRASDIIGRLPVVCVSAADMEMVRGEPSERRLFLDLELSALSPAYLRHFSIYKRALEQRNALLRESREQMPPSIVFEPWEEQIAHHGSAIREHRREYVSRLEPEAIDLHSELGDGEDLGLAYLVRDEAEDENSMRRCLETLRSNDIARGGTTVGPHRDDLAISVGNREARLYGSQGQQRSSVISTKLATMRVASNELGSPPLLLLDDILSDLDERRRRNLISIVLANAGQALLTCTEAEAAGKRILELAKVFNVRAGTVEAA